MLLFAMVKRFASLNAAARVPRCPTAIVNAPEAGAASADIAATCTTILQEGMRAWPSISWRA